MPHEFELSDEVTLDATPEQIWDAISTGPGIDSWFMGRNEVQPGVGGEVRMHLPGWSEAATITAWEPGKRLAYRGAASPDGRFSAFEYLIEARDGGSTTLRVVNSGFLGDDWAQEYDALRKGGPIYLRKLAAYLAHFPGRTATWTLFAPGPALAGAARVWTVFTEAFGLGRVVTEGERARLTVAGLDPVDGVVEIAEPGFLGVRTADELYLLIHGFQDAVVVEQHSFGVPVDAERIERAWRAWLDGLPARVG